MAPLGPESLPEPGSVTSMLKCTRWPAVGCMITHPQSWGERGRSGVSGAEPPPRAQREGHQASPPAALGVTRPSRPCEPRDPRRDPDAESRGGVARRPRAGPGPSWAVSPRASARPFPEVPPLAPTAERVHGLACFGFFRRLRAVSQPGLASVAAGSQPGVHSGSGPTEPCGQAGTHSEPWRRYLLSWAWAPGR